jgi:CubicO group peptidase (beta-lactamase class C family)
MLVVLLRRLGRIRVPRDLGSVTSIREHAEEDPRDAGMTDAGRDAIWSAVERLYRTGTQPAISLCLRCHGRVVLDRALGHARGNGPADHRDRAKIPLTPDTPICLFSASKAITAMVIHLLDEEGALHIDDPVVEYIPEFGAHGKHIITLRDLITHRAGIPSVPGSREDPEMLLDVPRVLAALYDAKPVTAPAEQMAYHALSGGYILGEVALRATGKTLREIVAERIAAPLGFNFTNYGVGEHHASEVALNYVTGLPLPFPISAAATRALGVTWQQATAISNDPRFYSGIIPSANVMTTANEVSRFYQLLLNEGELDGVRVYEPRTIRRAVTGSNHLRIDRTLLMPVRYGLGLLLGHELLSIYGPGTPRAFGHPGFLGILCWADPERMTSVGLLTTGKLLTDTHWIAVYDLLRAISKHCRRER